MRLHGCVVALRGFLPAALPQSNFARISWFLKIEGSIDEFRLGKHYHTSTDVEVADVSRLVTAEFVNAIPYLVTFI
jgi:hypothetical protein